ncbi:unnamed protein product [Schistocephalus solidus]|uniref:Fibronectin type-III domain-containing protein n=1 Tax=Schistocephalus solidus TaxID=70667 RepID=A0A183TFV9_SCHSO|nr:unnamed protein product [Schistocephalus solidus]
MMVPVPGPPRRILIKAIGSNALSISWVPPVDPISPATSLTPSQSNDLRNVYYSIDIQPTDAKGTWLATSESTPNILPVRQQVAAEQAIEDAKGQKSYVREINNLHPNTNYVVSVRAVTRSGSGDRAKSAPEMTWPLRKSPFVIPVCVYGASYIYMVKTLYRTLDIGTSCGITA